MKITFLAAVAAITLAQAAIAETLVCAEAMVSTPRIWEISVQRDRAVVTGNITTMEYRVLENTEHGLALATALVWPPLNPKLPPYLATSVVMIERKNGSMVMVESQNHLGKGSSSVLQGSCIVKR
jgi:hypothetical protein